MSARIRVRTGSDAHLIQEGNRALLRVWHQLAQEVELSFGNAYQASTEEEAHQHLSEAHRRLATCEALTRCMVSHEDGSGGL